MSKKSNKQAVSPQKGRYGISQNFLTSARTIDRMLDRTDIGPADHVWEIGAGKGHITRRLLARAGRVTAVEIDANLHGKLAAKLGDAPALRLLKGDFLSMPLPRHGAYKVFANIPFCHTSAIIEKLAGCANAPVDCWLVLERGAAWRFLGKPQETPRSLWLKARFDLSVGYHLRRDSFHPMPSVDAVLLHMHRRETPDLTASQSEAFMRFARAVLQGGWGARGTITRHQASVVLRRAGMDDIPPSATMRYVQWLCLFRWWMQR